MVLECVCLYVCVGGGGGGRSVQCVFGGLCVDEWVCSWAGVPALRETVMECS